MSLFSFFRKNKQAAGPEDSAFYSRAEADSQTVRPRKRKAAGRPIDGEPNAPVDPVLPEKKRARRRLVGAVALVLAVIIGLPMVLDSEPKPLADDVSIDIPSKDKPAPDRSNVPPAGRNEPNSKVSAAASLDQKEEVIEPASVASAKAPAKSADKAAEKGAEKDQPKSPEHARDKATDKVREKTGDKASEKASEKANDKAKEKASESARAEASAAHHERFTVQVAAFASMDKVNELRGKLKEAGIASYIQKITTSGGERIRIRVGPVNSREEAERMRAKLTGLGLSGTLVPVPS